MQMTWMKRSAPSLMMMLACQLACSEEPASSNNPSPKPDAGGQEMGPPDMPPDINEEMSCTKRTQCAQGACGMVDDGCGGALDCGACDCVEGVPSSPTCGICGLGVNTCTGAEASCNAPPLIASLDPLGFEPDACAGAILYVDSTQTSGGMGTKEAPYGSLVDALAAAKASTRAILIQGNATQTYPQGIELLNGVSLVGGWDDQWRPNPQFRPTIIVGGVLPNKSLYGVAARNINSPTTVSHLKFGTPDHAEPGASNYAFYVKDSTGLILDTVEISAGAAGKGTDGPKGVDGSPGTPGEDASPASFVSNRSDGSEGDFSLPNFEACRQSMPELYCTGARGGKGRYWKLSSGSISGEQNGRASASGGAGGFAGTFGGPDGKRGLPGMYMSSSAVLGAAGQIRGSVVDGYWISQGTGGPGGIGPMGGGGGGGGGAFSSGLELPPHCGMCQGCQVCPAPHGGGGGGGGEGGGPGSGGEPGGSSYGLFALNSKLVVFASIVKAGFAGAGGEGGLGGAGGAGGRGGKGGSSIIVSGQPRPTSYRGGDGERGLDGLPGGPGGGGAGGDSLGAFCVEGSSLQVDAFTRFEHGGQAVGGNSMGLKGEDGRGLETFGCN